jgi:hypothetical protein
VKVWPAKPQTVKRVKNSWAALTTVDNAAWMVYFGLSHDWTAFIPSCSVTLLACVLTVLVAGKQKVLPRSPVVIGGTSLHARNRPARD